MPSIYSQIIRFLPVKRNAKLLSNGKKQLKLALVFPNAIYCDRVWKPCWHPQLPHHLTLEYYRFCFVTLILSSGLPDPVFKNKKIPFPSTAVHHKNYTENISLTEQFEHLQSYFSLIWYDFWWKVSRPNVAKMSGMTKIQLPIKKTIGVSNFSFCILLTPP